MNCKICGSDKTRKNGTGKYANGQRFQKLKCLSCGKESIIPIVEVEKSLAPKIGITLNEFRQRHDLNFIVKKALESLNGNMVYEKPDIVRLCNLRPGYPGLNSVLEENKDLEPYRGRIAGKTYWASPDVINDLKHQGLLT